MDQIADYGDEFADHIAEIEKLKRRKLSEFEPKVEDESETKKNKIRKRKRKSNNQIISLIHAFENDPHWSKETLLMLSIKTGLTEA